MVAAVARWAHNPKVEGSIPSLATKKKLHKKFDKLKSLSYLCETIGKKRPLKSLRTHQGWFFPKLKIRSLNIRYLSVHSKVVLRNHDSLIKVIGRIWSLNKPRKWDKVNPLC